MKEEVETSTLGCQSGELANCTSHPAPLVKKCNGKAEKVMGAFLKVLLVHKRPLKRAPHKVCTCECSLGACTSEVNFS